MKPHAKALVGTVLAVAGAAPAMAADFSVRDLRGSYVVQLTGERRTPSLVNVRTAAVLGRLVADGEGGMQATVETVVADTGFTMRGSWFNCTYTVELDGTGRIECPVTENYPGGPLIRFDRWSIVVSARGDEFAMLYRGGEAPPGAPGDPCMDCVLSGTAKRQ